MKTFKVVLEGSPITIDIDGERQPVRFVVTRFVEAANIEEAKRRAMHMVRTDPKLRRSTDGWQIEHMTVNVGRAEEVPANEAPTVQPGFAFYPLDETAH